MIDPTAPADECDRRRCRLTKGPPEFSRGSSRSAKGEGKMSEPNMFDPTPELPDDTLISDVEFPSRIRNVLVAAGLQTVGEVRETSDDTLLSLPDLGKSSVAQLRETLGLPSTDGVRAVGLGLKAKGK
jgi:DNA-directed RNA polymerase alpha subunit